jgi:hypothetical protein
LAQRYGDAVIVRIDSTATRSAPSAAHGEREQRHQTSENAECCKRIKTQLFARRTGKVIVA